LVFYRFGRGEAEEKEERGPKIKRKKKKVGLERGKRGATDFTSFIQKKNPFKNVHTTDSLTKEGKGGCGSPVQRKPRFALPWPEKKKEVRNVLPRREKRG